MTVSPSLTSTGPWVMNGRWATVQGSFVKNMPMLVSHANWNPSMLLLCAQKSAQNRVNIGLELGTRVC